MPARISVTKGQLRLSDEIRYFFYVTNAAEERLRAERVVFEANDRCNQENVIERMKTGVHAMGVPSDNLDSNWARMLSGALAWNIKQWMCPHAFRTQQPAYVGACAGTPPSS